MQDTPKKNVRVNQVSPMVIKGDVISQDTINARIYAPRDQQPLKKSIGETFEESLVGMCCGPKVNINDLYCRELSLYNAFKSSMIVQYDQNNQEHENNL